MSLIHNVTVCVYVIVMPKRLHHGKSGRRGKRGTVNRCVEHVEEVDMIRQEKLYSHGS